MGRKKKYLTEEERVEARRESQKRWMEKNKEKKAAYMAKYYRNTKEERAEYNRERGKQYYKKNKETILEKCKEYRDKNKEKTLEYQYKYRSIPIGRATMLLNGYRNADKEHNRGECTLTAEWIVEHIFSQPCAYCGESDWNKLGCNRLDNSKPHTPDNVEPCCWKCNDRLGIVERSKKVLQYALDGEFVKEWDSISECEKNGFHRKCIRNCCNGKQKLYKGFIWRYKEEVA